MDEPSARSRREPNWQTLARTLRWLRTTPLGSPEEPEVKRSAASSLPRRLPMPKMTERTEAGRIFVRATQVMIFFLRVGRTRSMKMRSLLGGHGKEETFLTNGSAVMKRSTSACLMEDLMASGPAVKLRLTGVFPAKTTARLAMSPARPGGRTMATRGFSVSLRMKREKTRAAARILSKVSSESSEPSMSLRREPWRLRPSNRWVAREVLKSGRAL